MFPLRLFCRLAAIDAVRARHGRGGLDESALTRLQRPTLSLGKHSRLRGYS
jgi:hypothetical protein